MKAENLFSPLARTSKRQEVSIKVGRLKGVKEGLDNRGNLGAPPRRVTAKEARATKEGRKESATRCATSPKNERVTRPFFYPGENAIKILPEGAECTKFLSQMAYSDAQLQRIPSVVWSVHSVCFMRDNVICKILPRPASYSSLILRQILIGCHLIFHFEMKCV